MHDEHYIIDGYNVIRTVSPFVEYLKVSLEESRAQFIERLVNHAALSGRTYTVVFDGTKGASAEATRSEVLGVVIWFSARGQTADAMVEWLAFEHERDDTVTVVTADSAEQASVFRRGVYRQSPRNFVTDLLEDERQAIEDSQKGERFFLEDRLSDEAKLHLRKLLE